MWFAGMPVDILSVVEYFFETHCSDMDSDECTSCSEELEMDMMPKELRPIRLLVSAEILDYV